MKNLAVLAFAGCVAVPALAYTDVGVSINVVQPGVYGRIDIGNYAPPPVVYSQPVIIAAARYAAPPAPVYLYVPVGQQRDWGRYCRHYNACGRPVYFVQESWVRERWEHRHPGRHEGWSEEHHEHEHEHGHGHGHDHDHD